MQVIRWLSAATVAGWVLAAHGLADDSTQQTVLRVTPKFEDKRVAIVGGGAAGSSAAFWLKNALPEVETTVYEASDYIGGRSTVVPIKGDPSLGLIELGASIFVEVNYNMVNATKRFGLELERLRQVDGESTDNGLGIWDGSDFLFEESGNDYWDAIKIIWRYGLSPIKFRNHLRGIIDHFAQRAYDPDAPAFYSVPEGLKQMGLETLVNATAAEYLDTLFGEKFVREIIQTATRGNYGQDVDILHAFGALVSMAANGAWATEGGNYQVFEAFLKNSGATVRLNTPVVSIRNTTEIDDNGNLQPMYIVTSADGDEQAYDAVLIAAPLHSADIDMPFAPLELASREYHTVHVTLVAGVPDPTYFQRTAENVPSFIVSTGKPLTDKFSDGKQPFTTFSVHRYLENGESVFKLFSDQVLEDAYLDQLFYNHSWTYRKSWEAFPRLYPIKGSSEWPPVVLHGFGSESCDQSNGVIYINAFESCISTMETETLASKNAVKILRDQWCRKRECPHFGDGWGEFA